MSLCVYTRLVSLYVRPYSSLWFNYRKESLTVNNGGTLFQAIMDGEQKARTKGLRERLSDGDHVICGEGYMFELEQRGYLTLGHFVPEVVLDQPDVVRMLHREYAHAGSDVIEAETYASQQTQMKLIGREIDFELLNRNALKIAREVADEYGCLIAGSVCVSLIYTPGDTEAIQKIRKMFKEQIEWAVEEGADYIIGETFFDYGEADLALQCIHEYGKGLPAVITLCGQPSGLTFDGVPVPEACRKLEEAGACVVGLNCARGPTTMLPIIKEVRKACKGPVACLPVPYRTNSTYCTFQQFRDKTGELTGFENLDQWRCSRSDIAQFTRDLVNIGVQYIGICCGGRANQIRTIAETLGRKPLASKYSPQMALHTSQLEGANERSRTCRRFKEEYLFSNT